MPNSPANPLGTARLPVVLALLLAALPGRLLAATGLWEDPAFVAAFRGSYGFLSEREPTVTPEEARLLGELAGMIPTDPAAALRRLAAALKPDASAALDYTLAGLHAEQGRYAEAVRHYRAAIAKFPGFQRAHRNLGIFQAELGELEAAAASLTRALELGAEDGSTYGVLGYCRLNQDRYLSAEAAYRKAILLQPEVLDWRKGLAQALLRQERDHEAAALFEELIRERPTDPQFWLLQANAFIRLGQPLRAAENYEVLRRRGSAPAEALSGLGDIYLNAGLARLAQAAYQEAFAAGGAAGGALRAVGVLADFGATREAGELLREVRRRAATELSGDQSLTALRLEARLQLLAGETTAAARTLEEVLEQQPLDGDALLLLADHYGRHDEPDRAGLLYERAARLEAFTERALLGHAQLLVRQNRYAAALPLLRRVQELQPREAVAKYLAQVEELARLQERQ